MKKTLTLTLLCLFTGAPVALAHGARGPSHAKPFERLDQNADGRITLAEMKQEAREHFVELDADKNGKVSKSEIESHRTAKRNDLAAQRAEHPGMSGRGGGRESGRSEFAGRRGERREARKEKMEEHAEKRFAAVDGDGDGDLSAAELETGAAKRFAELDENGDQAVTREELREQRSERFCDKAGRKGPRGPRGND